MSVSVVAGRNVVVSEQRLFVQNDSISRRKKIITNPAHLNFEFPKTPKNTVQMSNLLVAIILRLANQSKVWTDSNIVSGRFGFVTVKPPCDFHVQMNDLDAGDSSRCN